MRYHYRCKNKDPGKKKRQPGRVYCGKRTVLDHKLHDPVCTCGKPMTLDPAVKRWNDKNLCRCDGAHYPHMRGQLPLCIHYNKEFDDDYWQRHDMGENV